MTTRAWSLVLLSGMLLSAGAMRAHHSVTAVFDTSKHLNLSGELSDIDWVNPHVFLYVKAKNSQGAEETWKVEGGPPAWYRRVGVNKSTFSKRMGEQVTIEGYPSKTGEPYGYMRRMKFGNGDVIESASPSDAAKGK